MDETLNYAPCGFLSLDDAGMILAVNATLLSRLGFSQEELVGAKVESILTMASRIFYQTHFFPLLALRGQVEEIFLSLLSKDQSHLPVLAYAKRFEHGNHFILVPVSERQKYEQEILAARKSAEEALLNNRELLEAQSQLASQTQELDRRTTRAEQKSQELLQVTNILFHDLREPIRKIEAFSGLLLHETHWDKETRLSLERISASCSRATQLLRALQAYVSVETTDDQSELIHLAQLVTTAYEYIRQAWPTCPSQLKVDPLPPLQGYQRQLRLLFEQLFDNAFRFRRPEVALEIEITATIVQENTFQTTKGRYRYVDFLQIFFSDNGRGIPQEYWSSVFQLLKKVDPTSTQPGCGLAICRKIVANHYGSISVVHCLGPGTKIKLLLPLKQEHFSME